MKRREFLLVSAGAGTAVAATGQAAGQEGSTATTSRPSVQQIRSDLHQEDNDANDDDDGPVEIIEVGDNGGNWFDPDDLTIEVGTTVRWVWVGNRQHNVVPTSQPDEADWEGQPDLQVEGEYEFTFEIPGTYEYDCTIHPEMDGVIEVVEELDDEPDVIDPRDQPIDPDEIGVPLQKHFIGIATFFAIFLTLVFAFYVLKYGETPHSGYPGRK